MEMDANVLTLLIIMAVAVWKVRETLKDLESRAAQQLRKAAFGAGDPEDHVHERRDASDSLDQTSTTESGGVSTDVARRLKDIRLADRSFDADRFLDSVRLVYEAVVVAFANGDLDLLRDLLSTDVYETFSQAIAAREERREKVELTVIGLSRAEIVDANIFNERMQITVSLESELVTSTRDEAGKVVAGDPARIITAEDHWTFAKEPTSRSLVWKLVATEAPQAADSLEKPIRAEQEAC